MHGHPVAKALLCVDLRLQPCSMQGHLVGHAQRNLRARVGRLGQHALQSLVSLQVIAGLRCRKNKTVFLLGMLMGHRWAPGDLFTSEAGARPEANAILPSMTTFLQKSSSIANRSSSAQLSFATRIVRECLYLPLLEGMTSCHLQK